MFAKLLARDVIIVALTVLIWKLAAQASATPGMPGDFAGVLAGVMIGVSGYLLHEWGHLLGALAAGSTVSPGQVARLRLPVQLRLARQLAAAVPLAVVRRLDRDRRGPVVRLFDPAIGAIRVARGARRGRGQRSAGGAARDPAGGVLARDRTRAAGRQPVRPGTARDRCGLTRRPQRPRGFPGWSAAGRCGRLHGSTSRGSDRQPRRSKTHEPQHVHRGRRPGGRRSPRRHDASRARGRSRLAADRLRPGRRADHAHRELAPRPVVHVDARRRDRRLRTSTLDCQGAHIAAPDRRYGVLHPRAAPTVAALEHHGAQLPRRGLPQQLSTSSARASASSPRAWSTINGFSNIVIEDSTIAELARRRHLRRTATSTGVTLRNLHVEGAGQRRHLPRGRLEGQRRREQRRS